MTYLLFMIPISWGLLINFSSITTIKGIWRCCWWWWLWLWWEQARIRNWLIIWKFSYFCVIWEKKRLVFFILFPFFPSSFFGCLSLSYAFFLFSLLIIFSFHSISHPNLIHFIQRNLLIMNRMERSSFYSKSLVN